MGGIALEYLLQDACGHQHMRTSCVMKRGRGQDKRMGEKGNTETEPERGKHTATNRAINERAREQKERSER